jgi:sigma-E factor negative regulatory protein RseC
MITERARIVAIEHGRMHLEPMASGCASCATASSCGTAKLSKLLPSGRRELVLPAQPGRRVGEEIELALPESALLSAAAVAYLPPLLGVVLGVVAGGTGAGGPLGAAIGLVLGLLSARYISARFAARLTPQPVPSAHSPAGHPISIIYEEKAT